MTPLCAQPVPPVPTTNGDLASAPRFRQRSGHDRYRKNGTPAMSEPDFSERVVIVTGAGKGIGQACALAFARLGAKVVISGRNRKPLEDTQEQIADIGAKYAIYEGDVADQNTAQGTVALALSEFGRLDFAVNNAGISPWVGTTAECSIEAWQQVISINLTGTWMGMNYQIPALLQGGGGAIVNMSSVAA